LSIRKAKKNILPQNITYVMLLFMKHNISNVKFTNYEDFLKSAKNWEHQCVYSLTSSALLGKNSVVELANIQLSCSDREGGFMHNSIAPPNALSIALIEKCEQEACFNKTKLKKGDILFFDDSKLFNFISKGKIKVIIISILKTSSIKIALDETQMGGKYIKDSDNKLSQYLKNIFVISQKNSLTMRVDHQCLCVYCCPDELLLSQELIFN